MSPSNGHNYHGSFGCELEYLNGGYDGALVVGATVKNSGSGMCIAVCEVGCLAVGALVGGTILRLADRLFASSCLVSCSILSMVFFRGQGSGAEATLPLY